MGLLDPEKPQRRFNNSFIFTPKRKIEYLSPHDRMTEEQKLSELNNMGREVEPEDYSTSPHLEN